MSAFATIWIVKRERSLASLSARSRVKGIMAANNLRPRGAIRHQGMKET